MRSQTGFSGAVVYDVIWKSTSPKPSLSAAASKLSHLRETLSSWAAAPSTERTPEYFLHRLSKHYPNIDKTTMSPDDRATVHLVQNACTDTGCRLFFVNVEHVIEGRACMSYYGNYGLHKQLMKGYDEGEGSVKITGLDGSVLADYNVYGSDGEGLGFLGDDWFDREPNTDPDEDDDDDMEEEDWVRKTYRDTAILIIPDNKLATFIMKHLPEDVAGRADLIERAFSTWQADKQEAWFGHWLRLCEAALENISKPDEVESKAAISTIIDTAITADHSGCQEILLRALKLSNLNAR